MKPAPVDHVERSIVIAAPRERVYAAFSRPELFVGWFPRAIDEGSLALGDQPLLDFGPDLGRCRLLIVAAEPPAYFAWRWGQGVDRELAERDPRTVPNTLVEFRLEEVPGGTRVTVRESGLAALPPANAAIATPDGVGEGWTQIIANLARHCTTAA